MMFFIGFVMLFADVLYLCGKNMPIRYSSTGMGEPAKPGVYPIIEDVIAVDCDGTLVYRKALRDRYEASPAFRRMWVSVSLFWDVSMILLAAVLTAVIFTIQRTVMWAIGTFHLPFLFPFRISALTISLPSLFPLLPLPILPKNKRSKTC